MGKSRFQKFKERLSDIPRRCQSKASITQFYFNQDRKQQLSTSRKSIGVISSGNQTESIKSQSRLSMMSKSNQFKSFEDNSKIKINLSLNRKSVFFISKSNK